jgi:hypothetical protein
MAEPLNWLDEVIIVNESADERVPGDVSVYRSENEALIGIESWWVKDGEGFAFTATGVRLTLGIGPFNEVDIIGREPCPEGPEIVLGWLHALAVATLEARSRAAATGRVFLSEAEEQGALPATVEGLLAYTACPRIPGRDWLPIGCTLLLAVIAVLLMLILLKLT